MDNSKIRQEVERDYPQASRTTFAELVSAHAAGLEMSYLHHLFERRGAAEGGSGPTLRSAIKAGETIASWVASHVVFTTLPLREWMEFCEADPEAIGKINGQPVLFNRAAGIYCYSAGPAATTLLELRLTYPHSPPGW
ncbi:hypothetical protein [Azonexus hydrophilus]|uniref:Uncharacterized protein n=1 Tax=Azonexus hydrophilus TaxID=418702 RepID=A0ABZ2XDX3_9RHOO